jgi:multidrug efflux pump subunit AcrB
LLHNHEGLSREGLQIQWTPAQRVTRPEFLPPQLVTVPGAAVPYPYGGKQRQVMVSLKPQLLQSKGLSPSDIVSAGNLQKIVLPSGTAKIDKFESIPLSILTSVIVLGFVGETINVMTLGGLALAVGILVDDATVTIENIERYLEQGSDLKQAIVEGAGQIAVPALVSTLCFCIVFLPMFFLSGVARNLFVPLAEAVVFAMLASYILSRTLVPTLAMYLLKAKHAAGSSRNPFVWFRLGFEHAFERFRLAYQLTLTTLVYLRYIFVPVILGLCVAAVVLAPWLGQDFFPNTDSGQFILHLRAKAGTRIEETAKLADLVEGSIRRQIPAAEMNAVTILLQAEVASEWFLEYRRQPPVARIFDDSESS